MGVRTRVSAAVAGAGLLASVAATAATPLPRLTAATVLGDRVTLTFSAALQPGRGAWTILVNGRPVQAKGVAFGGRRLQLVLPQPVFGDDSLRVVGRHLRSRAGARLKLVDVKPDNRSPAGCTEQLGSIVEGAPSEGPTDTEMFLDAGRIRILAVQVDYADAPAQPADTAPELATAERSIRDLSYGRASIVTTRREGGVRMPKAVGDYAFTGPWGARKAFFQDLVLRLDGDVDFAAYDAVFVSTSFKQGRGQPRVPRTIDAVVIAPAGSGIFADGRELRHFGVTGSVAAVRAILQLAGLPPLTSGYAGAWDPMGYSVSEAGLLGTLAWHRRKLGWLDPSQVRCLRSAPLEVTLAPMWRPGGVKAVVVPTSKTTAIVLENRQRAGLDAAHCRKGILAYEVRTDWEHHLWVLAAEPGTDLGCENLSRAPYDFGPKGSTRLRGAVTFEVLAIEGDGSYRLRVYR